MKGLRSIRRAHAVHLDDDEAELGLRLHAAIRRERLRRVRAVRPGVDVFDHRVLLRRIETGRLPHQAPDVGRAVAALGHEDLGRFPAGPGERGDVAFFDLRDERSVGAMQLGDIREVHSRIVVDKHRHIR